MLLSKYYEVEDAKPVKIKSPKPLSKTLKNHKISSFFAVAKVMKPDSDSKTEFFKPFYVKQYMDLAPINHYQAGTCRKYIKSFRDKKASCINLEGEQRLLKLKLLQFHDSLRPAFHGTMNITFSTRKMWRRPFERFLDVSHEYDYESELEWEDIVDAESVSTDESEDELEDCSENEDQVSTYFTITL